MNEAVPTSTAVLLTSTLPVTLSPAPSDTPLPPPPRPTATPVEGTSSTQINVRSEPSTSGNVLGMIPPNTKVQIVAKDPGGNWWQILYEQGVEGKGWVTAQFVTTANADVIPVIGGNTADPNNGNVAIIQQQINVRSGPGTGFSSLGTLNAQDVVSLTGKDANGAWLQISFSTGPDGKGWINAAFVQARGVENLPIITEAGQIIGTGTPTGVPPTPTSTVMPAWEDNDSLEHPVANVIFDPSGTNTLIYSGDISTPQGDAEDWVSFKPYSDSIVIRLDCPQNSPLEAELLQNGLTTNLNIACGSGPIQIEVVPNSMYSIHFYAQERSNVLEYVHYTIKIETSS